MAMMNNGLFRRGNEIITLWPLQGRTDLFSVVVVETETTPCNLHLTRHHSHRHSTMPAFRMSYVLRNLTFWFVFMVYDLLGSTSQFSPILVLYFQLDFLQFSLRRFPIRQQD